LRRSGRVCVGLLALAAVNDFSGGRRTPISIPQNNQPKKGTKNETGLFAAKRAGMPNL
jgi:hypothetical protein